MILFKHFNFDSAHFLPNVPDGHKCRILHGHTYRLTLYFEGELDKDLGWVIDFSDIKRAVNPIIGRVDHKLLNDIEGLENPTCEQVAIWLWDKIKAKIPQLCKIKLYETPTSGVVYEGA
ncbi:queuosine biosynthesis protein QueD [Allomuricauda ruestringensis DSM 13258]|uniref:6-carboxy-5,6,7,8-tetrahydropterin synthase n=1 Tax=Allomuricauda ruestringensis (strain DSM 13258 / CIP 107369 / LMG 19739 / B1) TaxID=886377 RepID=G2PJH7_ALLRU|nr:6-carboxytetrahydropterin synthase QueD [Allomuricauda ruestringensis]AEM71927.1 queuosine biosynthesis protein QueD [Allomuricauda ruestringensis DSM 13258]